MAPTKSPKVRLLHIRDEIDGLTAALAGVSFDAYCGNYTLRRAAERAVQIISEAAKMCYGTTISILTTADHGMLLRCICQSSAPL